MNIKELRKAHNLTQTEFARLIGCSQGLVALYEAGRRKPGWQRAQLIAKKLGIPVSHVRPDIYRDNDINHPLA